MKIFISWSGAKSRDVALALREWLPSVIQSLSEPWVSSADIEGGANWSATIGEQLSSAEFGIICVTQENQERSWLNFEAGAISKLLKGAVPLLVDFDSVNDLKRGPMSQLQVRTLDRASILALMKDINAQLPIPLDGAVLLKSFERAWDEFDDRVQAILSDPNFDVPPIRKSDSEKIDDILQELRGQRASRFGAFAASANRVDYELPALLDSLLSYSGITGGYSIMADNRGLDPTIIVKFSVPVSEVLQAEIRSAASDLFPDHRIVLLQSASSPSDERPDNWREPIPLSEQ